MWDQTELMEEFGVGFSFFSNQTDTQEAVVLDEDKTGRTLGTLYSDACTFSLSELRGKLENHLKDITYTKFDVLRFVFRRLPDRIEVALDTGTEQEEDGIRGTLKEILATLTFPQDDEIRIEIIEQLMPLTNSKSDEDSDATTS